MPSTAARSSTSMLLLMSGPSGSIRRMRPSFSNSQGSTAPLGEAVADAAVVEEVLGHARRAVAGEIGRRGIGAVALGRGRAEWRSCPAPGSRHSAPRRRSRPRPRRRNVRLCAPPPSAPDRRRGNSGSNGASAPRATGVGTLRRSVPIGVSRKWLTSSSASPTSESAGTSRSNRRRPASVSVTLRVVRFISRTPSCSSSRRSASLRVEAETPRSFAAWRKLRWRATATKESSSERSGTAIVRNSERSIQTWPYYRTWAFAPYLASSRRPCSGASAMENRHDHVFRAPASAPPAPRPPPSASAPWACPACTARPTARRASPRCMPRSRPA